MPANLDLPARTAMSFDDVAEYFDDTLTLPVKGKRYVIQGPDAEIGLVCQRRWIAATTEASGLAVTDAQRDRIRLEDSEELLFFQRLLGPVWEEMDGDGVPYALMQHVGVTAWLWVVAGDDAAEEYWNSPKAQQQEAKPPARKRPPRGRTSSPTT